MKKWILLSLFVGISLIMYLKVYAETSLSEDQIHAFRSAKAARIVVKESYGEAKNVSLPFKKVTTKILYYAGVKVLTSSVRKNDAMLTITIEANGIPLGYYYNLLINGELSAARGGTLYVEKGSLIQWIEPTFRYTAAKLSGSIVLEVPVLPAYEETFEVIEELSSFGSIPQGKYTKPSDAPFDMAFMSFVFKMLEIMGKVYGADVLIGALKDEDSYIRTQSAKILGQTGDSRAVEPLIAALKDKHQDVRGNAAEALGNIKDARAVEPLITALKDEDSYVRWAAAEALGNIKDARAVEPLVSALKDEDEDIRGNAAEALGEIGDTRAIEPLIWALKDKEWFVQYKASGALKKITGQDFGKDAAKWQDWWEKNKIK